MTALIALVLALPTGTAAQGEITRGALPPMPEATFHPFPEGIGVETVATGLQVVWSLEFAPDGSLFVTERPGRIRLLYPSGALDPQPWASLEDRVFHQGESGLTGLALHPDYPGEPLIYVMYTTRKDGVVVNRVSRIREVNGRGAQEEILLDDIPAQQGQGNHSGGRLRFGPDGMLYVSTGDAFDRSRAGMPDDLAGSILRITPEGEVPEDNPWPGNPVWAYGVRNAHGLDWQPGTGRLFAADHGPTGEDGVRHHDRILVVEAGEDHGWPEVVGAPGIPGYVDPILTFVPAAPPGDLRFYSADLMPGLQGDLFVTVLGFTPAGAQTLVRIRFDDPDDPGHPTAIERWFNDEEGHSRFGRLRGMAVGPDGALYIGTSNLDGRQLGGEPREGDDRILRIVPRDG